MVRYLFQPFQPLFHILEGQTKIERILREDGGDITENNDKSMDEEVEEASDENKLIVLCHHHLNNEQPQRLFGGQFRRSC